MKLILITTPVPFAGEIPLVCQLLELGLETLHVRKPGFSYREMRDYLNEIPLPYHRRLMLHSHHELAQEYQVKGLHFPEAARTGTANMPKQQLLFSTSFHTLEELQQPQPLFDYAFLSPIFNSISKEGYQAAFATADLEHALQCAKLPVVALGGVSMDNLAVVREMGFAGAAVLGAVWQAVEPVRVFEELQRQTA
ncbi:thiamine phosphate synthase [Pontibacter beigongshangensis]|uniref:thiamine phosphate synthase n=1 Tax=Pontibacter beigongshangensis TaxID=2574733 RepID=UPI00164F4A2D|nr:thiamine phosphate synthase [Pontibacter beigongshangensis]